MRNITVAITVDDKMGLAFNKRRQSRDRVLIADLCENTDGVIYVSPYSAPLFEEYSKRVAVLDSPLADCPIDSTCFVEMTELKDHIDDISALTVYRWNRHYPSDKKLDIDIESCGFTLSQSYEFVGKSHDKITKEIYKKHS